MAKNIRGNNDGRNGQNESYTIAGRGSVTRSQLVREVNQGKHPDHSTYRRGSKVYVRSNPDKTMSNNINR